MEKEMLIRDIDEINMRNFPPLKIMELIIERLADYIGDQDIKKWCEMIISDNN